MEQHHAEKMMKMTGRICINNAPVLLINIYTWNDTVYVLIYIILISTNRKNVF